MTWDGSRRRARHLNEPLPLIVKKILPDFISALH